MKEKIITVIDAINSSKRKRKKDHISAEQAEVLDAIHPAIIWGAIISAVVFLFFGLWAGLAQLDSAAIANGSVVLSASRKTVQHLEGGIISEILVKFLLKISAGLSKLVP